MNPIHSVGAIVTIQRPDRDHIWGDIIGNGVMRALQGDECEIALAPDFPPLPTAPILVSIWQERRYLGCMMLGPDGLTNLPDAPASASPVQQPPD